MFTADANPLAGIMFFDFVAGVVVLAALVRTWTMPAWMWTRGGWSKLGWAVTIVWLTPIFAHVAFPVGAVLALRHIRQLRRQPPPGPDPLPVAGGQADPAWWNVEPVPAESEEPPVEEEPAAPASPILALWRNHDGDDNREAQS